MESLAHISKPQFLPNEQRGKIEFIDLFAHLVEIWVQKSAKLSILVGL